MNKLIMILICITIQVKAQKLPKGFSYVSDIDSTIKKELRYCNHNNFVGIPINGYRTNTLITSTKTALALKKVQDQLKKDQLSLKIFDAYRPQSAVNHFIKWAKKPLDTIQKQNYYPSKNKRNLFKLGYISTRSGHSRGSAIDLTIINQQGKELDMGSPYDFFGEISSTYTKKISEKQLKNRLFLRKLMTKNGFKPYSKEWWHFSLINEPFPKTYFNFPVE